MISIIIPVYNRGSLLPETLDSIINQTYKLWECIIVDDGSTDNTAEIIEFYAKKDSRIQFHKRPDYKQKGANACRNYGFELSKGEFIHFFDSDDIMHAKHLEKKQKVLEKSKNIHFCICQTQSFEGLFIEKNLKESSINKITGDIYEDYILGRCSILMITPTWRREVLMDSALFDETLLQSQDLELYSRILLKFKNIEIIPENLIYVRRNNDSITTLKGRLNIHLESYLEVKKRVLMQAPNNLEINSVLIKMVLGIFRYKLANKEYNDCNKCLAFIGTYSSNKSLKFKYFLLKIKFFYQIFKTLGRGDTRFKSLLKLK